MEPMKTAGKIGLVSCLQGSQQPYHGSKEGHLPAGARTSRYFGDLKERNSPKSIGTAGKV